jgi:hypothetical protein
MTTTAEAEAAREAAKKAKEDNKKLKVKLTTLRTRLKALRDQREDWIAANATLYTSLGTNAPDRPAYTVGYTGSDGAYYSKYRTIPSPYNAATPETWTYKYSFETGDSAKNYWLFGPTGLIVPRTVTATPSQYVDNTDYTSITVAPIDLHPRLKSLAKRIADLVAQIQNIESQIKANRLLYQDALQQVSLTNPDGTLNTNAILDFKYNVGSVKEAYFSDSSRFLQTYSGFGNGSKPSAVTNAMQLWQDSLPNKGMIQYNTNGLNKGFTTITPVTGSYQSQSTSAFQFQYNPGSVNMQYQGITGVDPNFEGSGLDKFNATGATVGTSSTISFTIYINRMYDMKYYDSTTMQLRTDIITTDLYYPRQPSAAEQKDIFTKGTMYDLEFLLRTTLGMSIKVRLNRNSFVDGTTADLGWMTGAPVELHLGRSLRYWVFIGAIDVNHVLFNENMVPIFTSVGITANRIPDYATPTSFENQNSDPTGSGTLGSGMERWDIARALRE